MTIINQKNRDELKNAFKTKASIKEFNTKNGTKYTLTRKPLDLRPRKTRAIRRQLTKHQKNIKTQRQTVKELNFPVRKFAVTA